MLMLSSRWWGRLCLPLTIVDSSNVSCLHQLHALFSFSYMILQECFFYFWHRSSRCTLLLSIDLWSFSLWWLLTCKMILFWRAIQLLVNVVYLAIFLYEVIIISPSVYLEFVFSKLCLCSCFLASLKYGISCLHNFHTLNILVLLYFYPCPCQISGWVWHVWFLCGLYKWNEDGFTSSLLLPVCEHCICQPINIYSQFLSISSVIFSVLLCDSWSHSSILNVNRLFLCYHPTINLCSIAFRPKSSPALWTSLVSASIFYLLHSLYPLSHLLCLIWICSF